MKRLASVVLMGTVVAVLSASSGCQTWEGGMTLPSPHYLKDNPDYIPRAPVYPHSRELSQIQAAEAARIQGNQANPLGR